jgi:AcrR family transcriptional regulator
MSRSSSADSSRGKSTTGKYHHGDLKNSLIDAALQILERDGADALSMRAIAAEVGVSHTAPYAHFKNKHELIEAINEMGYQLLGQELSKEEQTLSSGQDDVVLCYGAAYLAFALKHPQLYRLMLGQVETRGLKEGAKKPVTLDISRESITMKQPFKMLNKALEKEVGDADRARSQALGAWALVHGLSALIIEGHLSVPDKTDLKSFLASVVWPYK